MARNFPIKQLADCFEALYQEIVQIAFDWRGFLELFDDKALVEMMNRHACDFFADLQRKLSDSLVLKVCRLTDPEGCGKFKNLGLPYFVEQLRNENAIDVAKHQQWQERLKQIGSVMEPLRHLRNKRIAHNDVSVLVSDERLPAQYGDLRKAIEAVNSLFNQIERVFGLPTTVLAEAILSLQHVNGIKAVLRDASELRAFIETIGGRSEWRHLRDHATSRALGLCDFSLIAATRPLHNDGPRKTNHVR